MHAFPSQPFFGRCGRDVRGSHHDRLRRWLLPSRPFPVEDLSSNLRIRIESTDIFLCVLCRVPGILGWGRCVVSFGLNGFVLLVSIPCFLSPVVSIVDDGWWYASRVVECPHGLGRVLFFCVWRVVHLHGWRSMYHGWYVTTQLAIHLTMHHRGIHEDGFAAVFVSSLCFLCLGSVPGLSFRHPCLVLPSSLDSVGSHPSFLGRRVPTSVRARVTLGLGPLPFEPPWASLPESHGGCVYH